MNQSLEQCKGKVLVGYLEEYLEPLVLIFDDGSELEIDIESQYCDNAWLALRFCDNKKAPISEG